MPRPIAAPALAPAFAATLFPLALPKIPRPPATFFFPPLIRIDFSLPANGLLNAIFLLLYTDTMR
jgi:hypothetical protein